MSTPFAEPIIPKAARPAVEEPLYEIVNGERVDLPPLGIYGSVIAGRLFFATQDFLQKNPLGTAVIEALFIFDREVDLRRRPNVAFVATDRWPLDREVPETGDWEVVPTLAVKVISPHDSAGDIESKIGEYFVHGVQAVWVVHPQHRRIYCHSSPNEIKPLIETDTLDGGNLLPGFMLPLQTLFRRTAGAATAK